MLTCHGQDSTEACCPPTTRGAFRPCPQAAQRERAGLRGAAPGLGAAGPSAGEGRALSGSWAAGAPEQGPPPVPLSAPDALGVAVNTVSPERAVYDLKTERGAELGAPLTVPGNRRPEAEAGVGRKFKKWALPPKLTFSKSLPRWVSLPR